MGIGTSLGAYYDDSFRQAAAQWNPKLYDDNELTPSQLQRNLTIDADPRNITDDSGSIVDYDIK